LRNCSHFKDPEILLMSSHKLATCCCPEPDESSFMSHPIF